MFFYQIQRVHADEANITKASVQRESPAPTEFTPDEQKCLQSLFFTEMHWRKNDVADPAPTTCAWLMQHRTYREWLDQGHGLLWIKGHPGTGKSTVLKHALETAERFTKQAFILASFFFHGRGAPNQRSTLGLFRSLLHQILQQNRDLLSKFTRQFKMRCQTDGTYGDTWEWQANELKDFFKSEVLNAARTQKIRIYIDALDECGEDAAIDLVEFFRRFTAPVSICFACRHYPPVALEGGHEICVEDENEQDIEMYVQEKIEAHIHRTDIAKTLHNEVVSRSRGNFQWVVLVIPQVLTLYKSRKSIATIQAMIQNTPTELHELYTGLLGLIKDQERAQSLRFMQWICFSFRPLAVRELRFALAINPDISHTSIHQCQTADFSVETDEDIEPVIYDLSKGLAEVQQHGNELIVQFIHQSVQDFLLEKGFRFLNSSIAGNVIGHGHLWITRSCIKNLSTEEVRNSAVSLRGTPEFEAGLAEMEESDCFGLLSYSSNYWQSHVRALEKANMAQDDLAALSTEASNITLHEYFVRYDRNDDYFYRDGEITLLHIATDCNFINVMRAVLTQSLRADQADKRGLTSLSIAAEKGHAILVELLLGRDDVDVNHKDSKGDTPLSAAAGNGHEVVMQLLLTREDVDRNSVNCYGDTPLSNAARSGKTEIVRTLLMKEDVDVNHKNLKGNTPLFIATQSSDPPMVAVLLQGNANPDIRNKSGATPLSLAASRGLFQEAKLLLERTINADSIDDSGRTPLSYACGGGCKEIVEDFLKRSEIDVNSRDINNRSVLSWAIKESFSGLVYYEDYKNVLDLLSHRHDILMNDADKKGLERFRAAERRRKAVIPWGIRFLPWW